MQPESYLGSMFVKIGIMISVLLALGCNGGGGGSETETPQSVSLTGQATIPNQLASAPLWIVADGMDGSSYASGASDAQGNFSFQVSLTGQSESVLLYAVDPDDPEMYAMALVPVANVAKGVYAQSDNEGVPIFINAESTAEVFVSMVSGLPPNKFTPLEEELKDGIMDQYLLEAPNLCSVEQTPILIEDEISYINAIRAFFDVFVNEEGSSLMLRLKRAEDKAAKHVTSLNQATGWRLDEGTGILVTLGLVRARAALRLILGEEFGLQGGLTRKTISREDLETAANIIVNPEGITGGYGNCREKGIVGAYIASRFKEFKQVAYVAAEADYSQPHGFAIACQQDEKVWDINNLMAKWDTNVPVPEGLYEADCVIIDPWAGITRELTLETVPGLKWKWIEHVMKVDLSTPAGDAEEQTARILSTAVHASFVPESIPSDEEIIDAICDPFEIPQNTDPKADEICDDDIDNNGDGAIDCDDSQCTENAVCNPCANDSGIYVWYVDNLPLKDVFVSSCESYYNEDALCGYSGGGLDCSIPAIKVLLGSGYGTNNDAINATCSTVSITYPCGSTWSCGWLGDIGGQQHVIDSLGGCQ